MASLHEIYVWQMASNVDEIHCFLEKSDQFNSSEQFPAPQRNIEISRRTIAQQLVYVLRYGQDLAGMFTLSPFPLFEADLTIFSPTEKPAYMARLAIKNDSNDRAYLGIQCVRKAIVIAKELNYEYLRCEANPDFTAVVKMLMLLGFEKCGNIISGEFRKIHLQKKI